MNSFQTIVLGIFGIFIIAGLVVIATVKTKGTAAAVSLTLWGSTPQSVIDPLLRDFFDADVLSVSYREIRPEVFDQELLEALASGHGPDMIILPAELYLHYRDKITLIPYTTYSERQFRDTFTQGGEIFLEQTGIAALPFSVDPLLMYYNRDMLDGAGIVSPPKYWDEFLSLGGKLTVRDSIGNISRSAVALGEYRNIANAKEILAALFMQSGNPVVGREGGGFSATLDRLSSASVLDFYTEFANSLKPSYSWNRSQQNSYNAFLAAKLAIYFGFGSEYPELRKANPNLNMDVALFPNPRAAEVPITYGRITGLAILRSSPNQSSAMAALSTLSSRDAAARLRSLSGLPPIRRDLLSSAPTDTFGGIAYTSAIRARGFLDPHPSASSPIFQNMIESITSGRLRSAEALGQAGGQLQTLIR